MSNRKKLGIVGGMGSVAAAYLFQRLVELTPSLKDQDYIETFIHNNVSIPDRTAGILYGGESPLAQLLRSVSILTEMGADYIILACMTSHYFIPDIKEKIKTANIIDAVTETVREIQENLPGVRKVGVMASTGAINAGIFQKSLEKANLQPVILSSGDQEKFFTEPIYADWGIKVGHIEGKPKDRIHKGLEILRESGAEAIIAGCSELPLVIKPGMLDIPLIDSIDILLTVAINKCCHMS